MKFSTVTTEKVSKVINSLKNTGSTGTDCINTLTIKKLKDIMVGPLTEIINKAIYSCEYPRLWKEGLITSLPKKDDLTLMSNWRPVTIINASSKIFEKIIHKQLIAHLLHCWRLKLLLEWEWIEENVSHFYW